MKILLILLIIFLVFFFGFMTDLSVDRKGGKNEERKRYAAERFTHFNPNPTEGKEKKSGEPKAWNKGDCVIRAFCGVLDMSWDEVYSDLCRLGMANNDYPNSKGTIERYAKEKGLVKKRLQSPMTVSEFARTHDGVYFINMRSHAVCVKDNMIHDCWDCGSSQMRYYYERNGISEESNLAGAEKCKSSNKAGTKDTIKRDPVVKAFCAVLGLPAEDVYSDLCRVGAEIHDMPDSRKTVAGYAKEKGLVKKSLPSYMPLSEFAESHNGTYLVHLNFATSCNVACVKGNKVMDDPEGYIGRSYKIRYYYEKP